MLMGMQHLLVGACLVTGLRRRLVMALRPGRPIGPAEGHDQLAALFTLSGPSRLSGSLRSNLHRAVERLNKEGRHRAATLTRPSTTTRGTAPRSRWRTAGQRLGR